MDYLNKFDKHVLLIAATRYFIGRMTISACGFAETLARSWRDIPENTRHVIKRDLEEAFKDDDESRQLGRDHHPLGMDCDRAAWQKVRDAYEKDPYL